MSIKINVVTDFIGDGIKKAQREFQQLEGVGAKTGYALKKAMVPATAAVGALAVGLFDAAKAAIADEKASTELARSLRQTTGATQRQIDANEDWISTQGRLLGITDDELRPALSKLARATGDVERAQKLATQAMDIAAATGKPLQTVTDALTKALGGNEMALAKLTPEFREMVKEGASFDDIMSEIALTMGGAATEAAETAEGRFKRLKLQLDETKESIGASLIPAIEKALPFIEKLTDWARKNPDTFTKMAAAVGALAGATVALNAAMAVNPYVAAAAGIVAFATAFEYLYEQASRLNRIGGLAARVLGLLAGGAAAAGTMKKIGDAIIKGILPDAKAPQGFTRESFREFKGLPALADGGIVTGPTLALIGEAGPEAVVPLDRAGGIGSTTVNISVNGGDPRAVVDALRKYMQTHGAVPIRIGGA